MNKKVETKQNKKSMRIVKLSFGEEGKKSLIQTINEKVAIIWQK